MCIRDRDTILRAMTNIITENGDEERGISIGEPVSYTHLQVNTRRVNVGSGQPDALRNRLGAHSSKDQSLASVVVVDFISGLILFPGTVLPVAMTPEQLDSVLHCLSLSLTGI